MGIHEDNTAGKFTRRDFIKAAGAATVLAASSPWAQVYAAGSDTIKVGLIGSGGRGVHDALNCLKCAEGVKLVAMGDLFADRLESALERLREQAPSKVDVTKDRCFTGWDNHLRVLEQDVDLVILTAPPHFRPAHLRAAVEAGKHVFMEKPVAVDPVGVRSVIESGKIAGEAGLTILAGTQARRMDHRIELVKRVRDGQIGEIISGECFRQGGALLDWGMMERPEDMSDMEWQVRRWLFQTWQSGDFICEMHIHELDITNWLIGAHPQQCMLLGGRQVRTDPHLYGDVYDHMSGTYIYPNGVRVNYMGSQIDGVSYKTHERVYGTKGVAFTNWAGSHIEGENPWTWEEESNNPEIQQHLDQINAMRNGGELNEAERVAESTLTAIMGRMSAYTGRELKWDWAMKASKLDLSPPAYEFGELPPHEIAVPGKTPLV